MKYLLILFGILSLGNLCCTKDENKHDCTIVTVTQSGIPCSQWGIKLNGTTYPSSNIPDEFRREGITVCAGYVLYEDMRLCACCGGTWADIKSIKRLVR